MTNRVFISIIILALTACTNNTFKMQSTSMEGTIKNGEYLEVTESESIDYGDIIAFKHIDQSQNEATWIFRVIGKAGDSVEIINGQVFVNKQYTKHIDHLKFSYRLNTKKALSEDVLDKYEGFEKGPNEYAFFLTDE